mmetsp:Transcript_34319/g.110645  ORF Transcript_34319/g.110645 Transcript_34319/m.110645 type:complete len:365 (-) Transcript_34319:21-1115(-)
MRGRRRPRGCLLRAPLPRAQPRPTAGGGEVPHAPHRLAGAEREAHTSRGRAAVPRGDRLPRRPGGAPGAGGAPRRSEGGGRRGGGGPRAADRRRGARGGGAAAGGAADCDRAAGGPRGVGARDGARAPLRPLRRTALHPRRHRRRLGARVRPYKAAAAERRVPRRAERSRGGGRAAVDPGHAPLAGGSAWGPRILLPRGCHATRAQGPRRLDGRGVEGGGGGCGGQAPRRPARPRRRPAEPHAGRGVQQALHRPRLRAARLCRRERRRRRRRHGVARAGRGVRARQRAAALLLLRRRDRAPAVAARWCRRGRAAAPAGEGGGGAEPGRDRRGARRRGRVTSGGEGGEAVRELCGERVRSRVSLR